MKKSIITACKCLLSVMPHFKVNFVKRETNMAAHTLAKRAVQLHGAQNYVNVPLVLLILFLVK